MGVALILVSIIVSIVALTLLGYLFYVLFRGEHL